MLGRVLVLSLCAARLVVPFDFSKGVVVFLDICRTVKFLFSPLPKALSFARGVSALISGIPEQPKAALLPVRGANSASHCTSLFLPPPSLDSVQSMPTAAERCLSLVVQGAPRGSAAGVAADADEHLSAAGGTLVRGCCSRLPALLSAPDLLQSFSSSSSWPLLTAPQAAVNSRG